ncbi:hypothetical protein FSB76_16510 [Mucilaginibacter ginsenosidivorax]|uniref:5-hmdU DNA kinase helical domain-containing protein n=2 Tax=Mucilaginibacter ginsenosidivorax TaxID=862126 RepID=A0A5B8WAY7_9SPHI|nr:hypothetical protein FSB76_16510 [Mucilaginibacter ginsenosidivorax]
MLIINKLVKPKVSNVYDTYWKFAAERQNVFFNKIANLPFLTTDPILQNHKFTNAYRASDRVSQYLIREVIYQGDQEPNELLFRILLFKIFNKIETWQLLLHEIGEITWRNYNFDRYDKVLSEAKKANETIYSGAYIMASAKSEFGYDYKHQNHLRLIELMITGNLSNKLLEARSLSEIYELLLSYPTIGPFLAYQYAIDINYSQMIDFNEMDFVVPGPGARDGISKCFIDMGDYSETEIIEYVTDIQESEFKRLGIEFRDLFGRPLQLIDCQNLFCETDKYARVAHPEAEGHSGRKRIKQIYRPQKGVINYWFPPKWGINENLLL